MTPWKRKEVIGDSRACYQGWQRGKPKGAAA